MTQQQTADNYCKTLYFYCILILRFSHTENLPHFNFVYFPMCWNSMRIKLRQWINCTNLHVCNFAILVKLQNSQKFDARETCAFYSRLSTQFSDQSYTSDHFTCNALFSQLRTYYSYKLQNISSLVLYYTRSKYNNPISWLLVTNYPPITPQTAF